MDGCWDFLPNPRCMYVCLYVLLAASFACLVWLADPGLVRMRPEYLSTVATVTWYNNTLWATGTNVVLDNIWFYASRMSVFYKARRLNDSDALPFPLPRFGVDDIVFMPTAYTYVSEQSQDWAKHFLRAVTGLESPRVEFQRPAGSTFVEALTRDNIACFKDVIITGAFGFVVRAALPHLPVFTAW